MSDNDYDTVSKFITNEYPDAENIALCSSSFKGKGGASRVIQQQAQDLSENGFNVKLIVLEADIEPPEDVSIEILGDSQTNIFGRIKRLVWPVTPRFVEALLEIRNTDLVISHRYPMTVLGYVASRVYIMSYIYWFHHVVSPKKFSGLAKIWIRILRYLESTNFTAINADEIVSVSQTSKNFLSKRGIDSIVLTNNVAANRFEKISDISSLVNKFGISSDAELILFVGRLTPQKNVHKLIEIFENINREHSNTQLVLVGSESDPDYVSLLREISNEDVIFTGYVSDEELAGFYSLSSVLVSCSLSESWYLPAEEASMFNTPVIAFEGVEAAKKSDQAQVVEQEDYEQLKKRVVEEIS